MVAPNILVVVVDGLRASALGAYGNTTFPTPELDRFAADSFLLDACYAASVDLRDVYDSLWQPSQDSLPTLLHARDYSTTLITDEPELPSFPAAAEFHHLRLSEEGDDAQPPVRAAEVANTVMAQVFASAAEAVANAANAPRLVWLHSRGMYGPWDAPLDLQMSLLDAGDPSPVETVVPPDLTIADNDDPDAAFRYASAYAAQVMVLDECWGALLDAIKSSRNRAPWLVTLIGARGYPLGEHRRIGGIDTRHYVEQLHVPWLIQFPDGAGRLARSNRLTSHVDLPFVLLDPSQARIRALATTTHVDWRDALVAKSCGHRAIRTADWCLREDLVTTPSEGPEITEFKPTSTSNVELFVRPDDRWEANDVAKLCPDDVEALTQRLNEEAPFHD